jgi:hypothetical protein
MAVILPSGWTGFQGGGADLELCGEEDCENPPCEIPPMVLNEGLLIELSCVRAILEVQIAVAGGVPPFTFAASEGQIVVLSSRSILLKIDGLVDFSTTRILIDGTLYNPCALIAYVQRGRAKYWNGDSENSACGALENCFGIVWNCFGEPLSGTLDGGGFTCHDVEHLADPQFKYSNCTPMLDGGWPPLCEEFAQGDHSAHCALPPCETGVFSLKNYPQLGVCTTPPTIDTETDAAPTVVAYLRNHSDDLPACDTRLDDLKALGCSPCKLLQGTDILVTVTDARGVTLAAEIHIE